MAQFEVIVGSLGFAMAVMIGAYVAALRLKFFSLVDVVWAYLFSGVAAIYTLLPDGWGPRKFLLLGMVTFWSVRLGTHLLSRLKAGFPTEDARYVDLRAKWALNLKLNFFVFYLFQGLSVLILAIPFLLAVLNPSPNFNLLEIAGVIVWLIGVGGEVVADNQLRRFKAEAANRGKVCELGLWAYSRHPNYFFEWVIWVGFSLVALPAPNGWAGLTSPLLMLYLLLKVTGVPYAEASSLKSRGDLYRAYQSRVSRFLPLPKSK